MESISQEESPLLRPSRAAAYLDMNERELRQLREKGLLPAVRFGYRTLRYRRVDLDALIESNLDQGEEDDEWAS